MTGNLVVYVGVLARGVSSCPDIIQPSRQLEVQLEMSSCNLFSGVVAPVAVS